VTDIPVLIAILKSRAEENRIRRNAVCALARIGPIAKEARRQEDLEHEIGGAILSIEGKALRS
jgi:hypothetical protein